MSKDRFDLENDIMECWKVSEDLKNLIWAKFDRKEPMNEDELLNLLQGLQGLNEIRFQKLWDTFEILVHDRKL